LLIVTEVLEPDGGELHNMLCFDILSSALEDYDEEDYDYYTDWVTNNAWYLVLNLKTLQKYWENEGFLDIEKKV
jgi:hypothetical protein